MLLKVSEGRWIKKATGGWLVTVLFQCLDSVGLNDVDGAGEGDDGRDDGSGGREDKSLGLKNGWVLYGLAGSRSCWLEAP